ncbi:MAG: M28 family peptidase [Nitrospirota bacterium]|nr:M28 family peptidase [Nitrospirota bacterium]
MKRTTLFLDPGLNRTGMTHLWKRIVLYPVAGIIILIVPLRGETMDLPSYLRLIVSKLSRDIGVRFYQDLERMEKTEKYIAAEFASLGYPVTKQSFKFEGRTYHNVIAELKGTDPDAGVLIIGAHYDSVRTTPGADDNASGIAGLLGIAKLLAGKQPGRTVRIVAFALEEPPVYRSRNMASYHYAKSLHDKKEKVEGMICLEMIGYFTDRPGSQHYPLPFMKLKFPKIGNFIAMVGNRKSKQFTDTIASNFKQATDLPFVTLNAPAIVVGIDFSDHWSFGKFNYPAFMVTDTAFYRNPNYHAPSDLPDTLDYSRMAKVVEGLAGAVEKMNK